MAQETTDNDNDTTATLGLKLRPFQFREITFLETQKRAGIAWDMGLGKTAAGSLLGAQRHLRRWLIVCPDNAFTTWRDEAPRWIHSVWPEAYIHTIFLRGSHAREHLWDSQAEPGPNTILMFICTPDIFIRDWGESIKFPGKTKKLVRFKPRPNYLIPQIVIFDEAKRIRNPESISYRVFSRFLAYYNITYFYPMTGTPGHHPRHFWTMLNLIDPRYFQSYWKFIYAFHEVIETPFGKEIGVPINLGEWHKVLRRYFSIVKETDDGIAAQRPPITRQLLTIDLDADQKRIYKELEEDLLAIVEPNNQPAPPPEYAQNQDSDTPLAPEIIVAQNQLALMTRLRQLLICPKILGPTLSYGNAIKDFANTVEPTDHTVLFTPFTAAFKPFYEYLRSKDFEHVYTLQGGMGTPARERTINNFRRTGGVIICSTLYAQAFSLEPATKSFAIGYDWDPDNNRQAEKRLHRLTTQNPVTSYYYTYRSTVDERLCEIVNIKQQHMDLTIPANLRSILS